MTDAETRIPELVARVPGINVWEVIAAHGSWHIPLGDGCTVSVGHKLDAFVILATKGWGHVRDTWVLNRLILCEDEDEFVLRLSEVVADGLTVKEER